MQYKVTHNLLVQNNYPPRPRWNHKKVKEAVAREIADEVRQWAEDMGAPEYDDPDREYVVATVLALQESIDAYQAGRYLEDFFEWPVTHELIQIFDKAFRRTRYVASRFVTEWVVENNVRFPAKNGDSIQFHLGDVELTGRIIELLPNDAKAIVKLNGNGKLITADAEEVIQIMPMETK